MRYGEWILSFGSRDVIPCACYTVSRCGCFDDMQLAWVLDMDDDDNRDNGIECLGCGATWSSYDGSVRD